MTRNPCKLCGVNKACRSFHQNDTHKPQQAALASAFRVIRCWETDETRSPSATLDVLAPRPLRGVGIWKGFTHHCSRLRWRKMPPGNREWTKVSGSKGPMSIGHARSQTWETVDLKSFRKKRTSHANVTTNQIKPVCRCSCKHNARQAACCNRQKPERTQSKPRLTMHVF